VPDSATTINRPSSDLNRALLLRGFAEAAMPDSLIVEKPEFYFVSVESFPFHTVQNTGDLP